MQGRDHNEKIYILLPIHNRRDITRGFVESLKAQTFQNFHLVLIDDGSNDGSAEMVRDNIANLTVIRGNGNWWWAGSLQKAYDWLKHNKLYDPCILIMNDDASFKNDFLEKGYSLFKDTKKTLMLPQAFSLLDNKLYDRGIHADWKSLAFEQSCSACQINCLSTRGLFIRASDFIEIGGFYPRMLPHYLSDYEFTIRAFRKGFSLRVEPSLEIWVNEVTTGYHNFPIRSIGDFFNKFFSKKSAMHPFYWTSFILLACPWRWKLLNLYRVWERSGRAICYALLKAKKVTAI